MPSSGLLFPCLDRMQSTSFSVRVIRQLRHASPKAGSQLAFNSTGHRSQPGRSYCLRPVQQDKFDLAPGEVDVWWLQPEKVADPGLLQSYLQLLTKQEQAYVNAGSSEAMQKERLLARTLQRTTLARYCSGHSSPPLLRFERNRHGKPCLSFEEAEEQPDPPLHFSLTHTSSMLGIAVSCGSLVGLDVEETRRHTKADPLKLARRRLTPLELADLEAIGSEEARAKRFVELWTLKEAYVKAVGQGISAAPGLKGFSILMQQSNAGLAARVQQMTAAPIADIAYSISFQSHIETPDTWGLMLLSLSNQHTAAVCLQTSSPQIVRQNSDDSNASTDTTFDQPAYSSMFNVAATRVQPTSQLHQNPVKITFRSTIPLVTDDVELLCRVEAVGGL